MHNIAVPQVDKWSLVPHELRTYDNIDSGADCKTAVLDFPVCANSTWNMFYANSGHYFCCTPGQIGTEDITLYGGLCEPANQAIPTSLLATLVSQVVAPTAAPSTIAGGSTNASTTSGPPLETNPTIPPLPSSSVSTGSVEGIISKGFSHSGVIASSVVGFGVLVIIIACVVRRRHRSTTVHLVPVGYECPQYGGGCLRHRYGGCPSQYHSNDYN